MMVEIKGITWDHPRGYKPLQATAEIYQKHHPLVQVSWDVRSLKDFGDSPIENLVDQYDLLLIDHPFIGTGASKQVLLPLDEWIDHDLILEQKRNSVGKSFESYTWEGSQYALPVDAAAQVAAARLDILQQYDLSIPKTWDDVFSLADSLPANLHIGLPLVPTDVICSFVSIAANIGGPRFWTPENGIDKAAGEEAVAMLQKLHAVVHPLSTNVNPIGILDFMAEHDELVYAPLIFGYVTYSQPGFARNIIHFFDVPSHGQTPAGSVLGGVGLAVSALSQHKKEAVRYLEFVAAAEVQKTHFLQNYGQPGHRSVWLDETANQQVNGFFHNTIKTLDNAYLRPRHVGYNKFQEKAGDILHQFLLEGGDRKQLVTKLNSIYLDLSLEFL